MGRRVLASALCALLIGTFVLVPPAVQAQSNGDGSFYSRYGLGTLKTFSSSQSEALGGGAYALRSLNYNPMANPALWSDQVFTRLSGGASYTRIDASASGPRSQSSRLTAGAVEIPDSGTILAAVDPGITGPELEPGQSRILFQGIDCLRHLLNVQTVQVCLYCGHGRFLLYC